jgi:hypothetical protein
VNAGRYLDRPSEHPTDRLAQERVEVVADSAPTDLLAGPGDDGVNGVPADRGAR